MAGKSFLATSVVVLMIVFSITLLALTLNQTDNFQDGTFQSWGTGGNNPNLPSIITSGGPAGAGDKYLHAASTGGSGAGSKLVIFNQSQWTGNFSATGITTISMNLKNEGSTALSIRVALRSASGDCISSAVSVPVGSGWIAAAFSLAQGNVTVTGTYATILSSVTEVRILHSTSASANGEAIAAQLGIDNVTAAATPLPVELTAFTANISGNKVALQWRTVSEANNNGFEIEKSKSIQGINQTWEKIGFVEGHGTDASPHEYNFSDASAMNGTYAYRLKQFDNGGMARYSSSVEVRVGAAAAMFTLLQNYPNPFNPETKLEFQIPESGLVKLSIFDILGHEVTVLVNQEKPPGVYAATWNAANVPSGIYFYKLTAGTFTQTRKMVLMR